MVDAAGVIVVGHTRLLAARKLGMTEVPVAVAIGLTPAQCKAYRIMDNRSAQETAWDMDLLGVELLDLKGLDIDLKLTGFDTEELTGILIKAGITPGVTDADAVPETPVVPTTVTGDLWLLGDAEYTESRSNAQDTTLYHVMRARNVLADPWGCRDC